MIDAAAVGKIIEKYDQSKLSIGTLGSHSSLNIFKGAKEEGFRTVCICKEKDAIMYQKIPSRRRVNHSQRLHRVVKASNCRSVSAKLNVCFDSARLLHRVPKHRATNRQLKSSNDGQPPAAALGSQP